MLELRPNCECCDRDLPFDSAEARICTFECTFCADCVDGALKGVCPNCGGGFVAAPDPAGAPAGEISGLDDAGAQTAGLRGRMTGFRFRVRPADDRGSRGVRSPCTSCAHLAPAASPVDVVVPGRE